MSVVLSDGSGVVCTVVEVLTGVNVYICGGVCVNKKVNMCVGMSSPVSKSVSRFGYILEYRR